MNVNELKEVQQILNELYDFIDGIEMMTETERELWNGEDSDGLQGRTEHVQTLVARALSQRGKQDSPKVGKQRRRPGMGKQR